MVYNAVVVSALVLMLPLQFILPSSLLFLLVCLIILQLFVQQYLTDIHVYMMTGLSAVVLLIAPSYGAVYLTAVITLLLLLRFVLPSEYLLMTVNVIVTVIVLQVLVPSYLLLMIGIGIMYCLLKEEYSEYRKSAVCYALYAVYISLAVVISLIMLPVALVWPFNTKTIRFGAYFAKSLSRMLGITWQINGVKNLPKGEMPAILISNHQNIFDALGMAYLIDELDIQTTSVAQKSFFWIWPIGLFLWLSGIIFVSRKKSLMSDLNHPNDQSTVEDCFSQTIRSYLRQNVKIWFFLEDEFDSNADGQMIFRKEAFSTAITLQVPIIPIAFSPYNFISWEDKCFDTGTISIEILPAIETKRKTLEEIMNEARDVIKIYNELGQQ